MTPLAHERNSIFKYKQHTFMSPENQKNITTQTSQSLPLSEGASFIKIISYTNMSFRVAFSIILTIVIVVPRF